MSASQLPENMGKKIVEALKKKTMCGNEYVPENSFDLIKEEESIVEEPSVAEVSEFNFSAEQVEPEPQINLQSQSSAPVLSAYGADLPTNVSVLKKLVNQLPAGVSKQVGAQIIRQTMEALGISMNGVLKEAQEVHNGLSAAIQECNSKAQGYKKEIMHLENNIREFQRQAAQINEIISVFVMTDKK